jgi:hypothetical protein
MSALGHKRTFAVQKGMSALLPKADMCGALAHVCFVTKAGIPAYSITSSTMEIRLGGVAHRVCNLVHCCRAAIGAMASEP